MKSKLTLPSYKSPLSMAISQSCGGRGWRLSCLSDGSFWECLSSVPVSQKSWFVFFLFFFEKCPLYTCRLRNIELQTQEAATQVKKFSAFLCMRRCKSQGSFKWFPWYVPHLSGDRAPVFSLSSGFTIGSDCSLIRLPQSSLAHVEGLQSLISFLRSFFLVMDLTDIWETFPDQLLSHGAERLIPDQAKMLDTSHQLVNFGPGPINNENSLVSV